MKRIAIALLFTLAPSVPFSSTARADEKPARTSKSRHVSAHDLSLIASLFFMPWSAMALAHDGAKAHSRRAKHSPGRPTARDAAPAAAATEPSGAVNTGTAGDANAHSQPPAASH
jgi:hypothetical protein